MSYLLEGAAVLTVDTENAASHRIRATIYVQTISNERNTINEHNNNMKWLNYY
jgi:hypothetical protein